MAHDALLANAARPRRTAIFNLPLVPYSLGHELLLQGQIQGAAIETATHNFNDFQKLPEAVQRVALIKSVLICSRNWQDNQKRQRMIGWWIWWTKNHPTDEAALKFYSYRLTQMQSFPLSKMPRQSGVPFHYFGAPEVGRLMNFVSTFHSNLAREYGSLFDFPFSLALMLHTTHEECAGNLRVKNWLDLREEERMKAYEKLHPEPELAVGADAVREMAKQWNARYPNAQVPVDPEKN